jgi:hypothetical protein
VLTLTADDNHKPEMTIAITPFDGLCGFRPLAEISHFLSTVKPLRSLLGEPAVDEFNSTIKGKETSENSEDAAKNKEALKTAFSALMTSKKSEVVLAAKELVALAEKEGDEFAGGGGPSNGGKELADLVIRLNSQFDGDIGLFVLFFLNYVKLEVGEAMFLKADDIHAYLSGGRVMPIRCRFLKAKSAVPRYHRVYGVLRQCGTRWFHAKIPGHLNADGDAYVLVCPHFRAEDEPLSLSLCYAQQHCILFWLLCDSV